MSDLLDNGSREEERIGESARSGPPAVLSITNDLSAIKYELLGVQASLPAGVGERDPLLESYESDALTELRTTIACVLRDHLEPAEAALGATFGHLYERYLKRHGVESGDDEIGEGEQ